MTAAPLPQAPDRSDYDRRLVIDAQALLANFNRAGVVAHLIREQIDVTTCRHRLLDDDFPLDWLPPAYWQRGLAMERSKGSD